MFLLIFPHNFASIVLTIIPHSLKDFGTTNTMFNGKNRKTVHRIFAVISILAMVGMLGFTLIALFQ